MKKIIRATTVPISLYAFCDGLLSKLSTEYEVIALSSPGELLEKVSEREGVRTIAIPMERRISIWKDLKSLFSLIKVFRKERPDMVHSMTPKAGLLCMLAGRLTRVPVRIHTFTGLVWPTTEGVQRKVLMLTDRITCACATHIIPEGEGVKNDLISGKITKKSLKVLGYGNVRGTDMDYYDRTPEVKEVAAPLIDKDKFTFLFVGRIVKDKGVNELVNAFLRLNLLKPETRLFLVGPYEDDIDPVLPETRKAIDDNEAIIAVGRKSDVRSYYAASDCFVFPSYREGFPNTVLEAGAMGLPSIVTDINGSREIIEDGFNGLIVPSKNEDALFDAMQKIVEDSDLRDKLSSVARQRIEERFEKSFVQMCLIDFYHRVL